MRLVISSLFLLLYIAVSLISFLPCRLSVKVAAGIVLLVVSQKYFLYEKIGGSFLAPRLPLPIFLSMEVLYAVFVLLFFLLLTRDGLTLLLWISRCLGTSWRLPFPAAVRDTGIVMAALILGGWGAWQSIRVPDVRTVEIPVAGLSDRLDGFTLIQLSDIHIGLLLKKDWLAEVVRKTNSLAPDLVVLTGDMIDGSPGELEQDIAPLGDLRAHYGVYGVTGNHEYYFQAEQWLPVFRQLGVDMLQNEHRTVLVNGAELVLAGIPDPRALRFGGHGPDARKALEGAPDAVRILLAHQPSGAADNIGADIQLSGHTHGGHLFFLKPLVAAFNEGFVNGLYDVNGMKLYVSPGTGIWAGFSCRLGVPSEITRIVLRAE